MKIYSYTAVHNELDQFVGTDAWVLCEFFVGRGRIIKEPHWSSSKFWVRFLDDTSTTYRVCSMVATRNPQLDADFLETHMTEYLNHPRTEQKSEIRLVEPLQTLTED